MKQLVILVPEGENNISSIVGSFKIFSRANNIWKEKKGRDLFQIQLAGNSTEVEYHGGLFAVRPQLRLDEVKKAHLVIIPSLNHHFHEALKLNGSAVSWVRTQYEKGAEVASICTGAFLLAATGIIDGKSCSTHWSAAGELQRRFPLVQVKPDRLITDEAGIYTNGGAYSFLNLLLYLVEKYYDRAVAIQCSKIFQIEIDRNSQSPFSMFTGQKQHGDGVVQHAQQYIESHLDERITVKDLSSRFSVGRRNFDRRFIAATGNTPLEYAQRVRIEAAKKQLERGKKTVNEVMYAVGYSDPKAFREIFRRLTGLSPLEYRNRYCADVV